MDRSAEGKDFQTLQNDPGRSGGVSGGLGETFPSAFGTEGKFLSAGDLDNIAALAELRGFFTAVFDFGNELWDSSAHGKEQFEIVPE